ncbi:DNA-directed RNA polymerase [Coemansia sp. RSA 2322]|nr:DNA-directed RNA polymerase [Coemansia sp. RSA 2322]
MMKEAADVSVHNEIIGGLLTAQPRPLTTEALLWYDQMERYYHVKPNTNTFAILIRGFIASGMRNVGIVLMQEMLRCGHTFHDLLLSTYLSDTDIDQIKDVARGIISQGLESSDVAANLLNAVNDAEERLESLSAESDSSRGHAPFSGDNSADMATSGSDASDIAATTQASAAKATQVAGTEADELLSTNVLGIEQLRNTLKSLYSNELEGYNLQMRLERDTYESALSRFHEINAKRGDPLLMTDLNALKKLSASWLPQLEALVEEEQERCRKADEDSSDRVRATYGRFLLQLDAPRIAIITILEVLRLSAIGNKSLRDDPTKVFGVRTALLVNTLSTAVQNEIRFERMKMRTNRHITGRNMSVAKLASSGKLFNMAVRRAKAHELRENSNQNWLDSWDITTKTRIGSVLLSMLLETARLPEIFNDPGTGARTRRMVPAFTHEYMVHKGRKLGMLRAHSSLKELFKTDSLVSMVNARHLPMLVPPRPWLTFNSGGYLTQDEPCMRVKDGVEQLRYLKKASNSDRLYTLLAGLDSLGLTKWSINRPVFEVVRKVWNAGMALAKIPASAYTVPEPAKPANYDTDDRAKLKYRIEMREWTNNRANQHSERCDCNYKVEIARAYLNYHMYFPHNMDFRGRAYPIPPLFNHLGNDLCRGLLTFHEGRPLTERGLYWLQIHLANLFGKDKLSHDERLAFVEENLSNIMASADDPVPDALLHGEANAAQPWWLEAEDPWQALAACIEYTAAIRSPNPKEYVSRLHVHQDGTCNGLQHYAAMGRDKKGAMEVNLIPSDRPQDVYTGVLNGVLRLIEVDFKQGVEEAVALNGKLTRKIVKQTVMTNVYGVTLIGAKEQIAARLRELKDENGQSVFDIMIVSKLSMYVAKKIFESLGEMFTQAQQIQNWLNESARRIAKSMPAAALESWKRMLLESKESQEKLKTAMREAKVNERVLDNETILEIRPDLGPGAQRRKRLNSLATKPMTTVVWTTPLGLTVVQPYRKMTKRNVVTNLQSITVRDANMPSPVNSQKQKTAFPPNYVHSLDASHMTLSAIECKKAGLVFASVHDSYWTHACDVDTMNNIIRDQFVKLHQRPIMADLKAEFEDRYKDHMMPVICWEYVSKDKFLDGGKIRPKKARVTKKTEREEQEKLIEIELARQHLEACGESSDDVVEAAENAQEVAANLAASMKLIDLNTVELVDPRLDLPEALRQSDHISYTLSVNRKEYAQKLAKLRKEHRVAIRLAKVTKMPKNTVVVKASRAAKSAAVGEPSSDAPDAAPSQAIAAMVDPAEVILKLEQELEAKIAELDRKYVLDFKQKPITLSEIMSPELLERANTMVKNGELAGRLTKRVAWVGIEFDALPEPGDFDINEVQSSPYFFS